ncbi:kinesin-like protein KIN-12B [Salvia hispanica]|uniref:kinesin-like protein KIN-12B n=1 Tax=Salvia hispanica TaxID=49212 RepID=UPI00200903E5|nr:kinesin-like protein KIN-12B [Salvia hispanica]
MKNFMSPRNLVMRENHENIAPSPNPKSKPTTPNPNRKLKSSKENAPPTPASDPKSIASSPAPAKMKSPLPPRPPLKRKLADSDYSAPAANLLDSGVKVIVRVRPPNNEEEDVGDVVYKKSQDSLTISGQTFTFDSVADIHSKQSDIFELVGAPLIENCLAGFNSSVFAYGQTGSGKTYTIWGASNALLEKHGQGLAPRVFHRLFERINEEQNKQADRNLVYMCRCSFLEIYNEQITDLLEPSQKNLQIREDAKIGVYVENIREECVSSMKDVSQLLLKGLSNRRTGATCVNAESSRSHSVFTCVVESRGKSAADGLTRLKMSKINFVDLAGSERQKQTGAAGERLKEAGNINRSLSQLGNLINILAEVSQSGKQRHIPYRDSKLTFLLQESLGGNAKLAMICAISPSQSCKSETLSTLRFAQRAKAIKNKAIINEEMQEDVNVLRKVIGQLRDELHRMKANQDQTGQTGAYATGWSAKRSLNLLRFSLNRPMVLPHVEDDSDEEMEIVDTCETTSLIREETSASTPGCEDADVHMEDESSETADKNKSNVISQRIIVHPEISPEIESEMASEKGLGGQPVLKSPIPSVSPIVTSSRKSLRLSSTSTASQGNFNAANASIAKPTSNILLNSQSTRKFCLASAEQLAATLNHGLDILQSQRLTPAMRRSSFRFSCMPADFKAVVPVVKVDVGVQTLSHDEKSIDKGTGEFLCSKCMSRICEQEAINNDDAQDMQLVPINESSMLTCNKLAPKVREPEAVNNDEAQDMQLVPINESSSHTCNKLVPKAVEKVLAGAIRREMALEDICAKQTSEITQLNRLVQQYKHERECNAIIGQTREDKIVRLEGLMDGILPTEEFMEEELLSLTHEHKILQEKCDNHPDILRTQVEFKRVQDELERYQNFFDLGERDVLLEEIQDLRAQLQYYLDSSPKMPKCETALLQLTSCEPRVAPAPSAPHISESPEERIQWTEAESKWISLVDELRLELEANQSICQRQKQELDMEKKCSEELKEAMQMAMEGHARMLEQYAELEEKHILLLGTHRSIQDGVEDVKKAAVKAGVKGAESKFINALAAEISVLKAEREKERRHFRDENRGLQAQLRDTAEAVQAAGELLVRLKEADEAMAAAEKRAIEAELKTENAYKEIEKLNKLLVAPDMPEEDEHAGVENNGADDDQRWREEFEPSFGAEDEPPSWFSGYDRCNI